MDQYRKLHPFEALLPVSALTGEGVPLLLEEILKVLPESPPYYPEDMITDQTERFLVCRDHPGEGHRAFLSGDSFFDGRDD